MIKMPKLEPCPFCGGKAALFVGDGVRVFCTNCHVQTRILQDGLTAAGGVTGNAIKSVIEDWNKRIDTKIDPFLL